MFYTENPVTNGLRIKHVLILLICLLTFAVLQNTDLCAYAEENEALAADETLTGSEDLTEAESVTDSETSEEEESVVTLPGGEDVYSILLIGSDRREDNWNGNSDVMIVLTVNTNTKKIIMTSYMRDLYATIPGYGVHKLNYAYAAGGAETLIATLEDNYDIEIDNYAAVDFETMGEIIDLIGGVDIALTEAEVEYLNTDLQLAEVETEEEQTEEETTEEQSEEEQTEVESEEEQSEEENTDTVYHLTGEQAVSYMRIRYVGNADYQRTQRQRTVLAYVFEQAKEMSAAELVDMAQEILSMTTHDISALDVLTLLGSLSGLTEYELVENRIPYDDLFSYSGEMLVPDYAATIERLHETLYE